MPGVKILIVDDSSVMRRMVKRTIEMGQIETDRILEAGDGNAALVILRSEPVDIALLDVNMPIMSGLELLETMRADETLKAIPVIIISTEGSDTRRARFAELDASFIHKPFTPEEIVNAIQKRLA